MNTIERIKETNEYCFISFEFNDLFTTSIVRECYTTHNANMIIKGEIMKRWIVMLVLVIFTIVPFTSVHAFNLDTESPHILADFMPEETGVFAASRVGADFIAELDAITVALSNKMSESLGVEAITIDSTFRELFADEDQDWDKFIAMVGKYAAIGVEPVDGFDDGLAVLVVEITDQAGVEEFILELSKDSEDVPERQTDGDTVIYLDEKSREPLKLMITPTHLIFTNNMDYSPNVETPLSASADFTNALSMLTADTYNSLIYVSESVIETAIAEGDSDLQEMGVNPEDGGAMVAGFTILDEATFTFDMAIQTISPVPTSTVSIDFLNALPSSTDTLIFATDLTNVYNSVAASIRDAARANDEQDPTAQIPLMFNFTGLDLEDDVLSWTTGAYGVFMGADFASLFNEAMTTGSVSNVEIDAGIIIEATDIALAQNAASKLGEFMTMAMGSEQGITITQDDTSTSIKLEMPIDPSAPPLELEFVLTTTDKFFFFGTRSALDKIMSGDTLASNEDFSKAAQYYLDNPTGIWYSGSDGAIISTIAPLALMGPAIGNVFEEVVRELGSEPETTDSSEMPSENDMMMEMFQAYDDIFSSMTVTTSVDGQSVVRIRGTLAMNP